MLTGAILNIVMLRVHISSVVMLNISYAYWHDTDCYLTEICYGECSYKYFRYAKCQLC